MKITDEMVQAMERERKVVNVLLCRECSGKPCICESGGLWAAHCMDCDNQIGEPGYYDSCCATQMEAIDRWNHQNSDCGHHCNYQLPYGFVPEADCPVHDVIENRSGEG